MQPLTTRPVPLRLGAVEDAVEGGIRFDNFSPRITAHHGHGGALEKGSESYARVPARALLMPWKWSRRAHTDTVKPEGPKKEPRIGLLDTSVFPERERRFTPCQFPSRDFDPTIGGLI